MGSIEIEARRRLLDRRALLAARGAEREVVEIDEALLRLALGSFGICETCGVSIGRQRLLALPETRHCSSCAG